MVLLFWFWFLAKVKMVVSRSGKSTVLILHFKVFFTRLQDHLSWKEVICSSVIAKLSFFHNLHQAVLNSSFTLSGVSWRKVEQEALLGGGHEVLSGSRSQSSQFHKLGWNESPTLHYERDYQVGTQSTQVVFPVISNKGLLSCITVTRSVTSFMEVTSQAQEHNTI